MFAYCEGDPVNLADPNGRDAIVRSGLYDEEWLRANTPSGNSATPSKPNGEHSPVPYSYGKLIDSNAAYSLSGLEYSYIFTDKGYYLWREGELVMIPINDPSMLYYVFEFARACGGDYSIFGDVCLLTIYTAVTILTTMAGAEIVALAPGAMMGEKISSIFSKINFDWSKIDEYYDLLKDKYGYYYH